MNNLRQVVAAAAAAATPILTRGRCEGKTGPPPRRRFITVVVGVFKFRSDVSSDVCEQSATFDIPWRLDPL